MKDPKKTVDILELRRLLVEIREHRPDICIRYRLIGKMWAENFLRIIQVTEDGVLLNDETSNKFIRIPDIAQVIQFELDKPFQQFQPYFHYEVVNAAAR